jgi:DnaK suppressor protein
MLTLDEIRKASEDDYMNEQQLEFFRHLLMTLRDETVSHIREAKSSLANNEREADVLDQAIAEEDNRLRLRIADRESKLLPKIDSALKRIANGTYGYCIETGEPIGVERLLLRPTATLCAEEKARQEQMEKNYRED